MNLRKPHPYGWKVQITEEFLFPVSAREEGEKEDS